jgi:hypothetical protein
MTPHRFFFLSTFLATFACACSDNELVPHDGGPSLEGGSAPIDAGFSSDGSIDAPADVNVADAVVPDDGACLPPDCTPPGGYEDASCPTNVAFSPPPYVPVPVAQGVCATADINTYLAACGDNGDPLSCEAWFAAQAGPDAPPGILPPGADAGQGTACGRCIAGNPAEGGSFLNSGWPNFGACIQAADPSDAGAACGAAVNDHSDCDDVECPLFGVCTDILACYTAIDQTICQSYAQAQKTACASDLAADGGRGVPCVPVWGQVGSPNLEDSTVLYVINAICGSGSK